MICDKCNAMMKQLKDMGIYEIWECKECGYKIELDIHYNVKELED